jgi:putative oxidoreductase
MNRLLWIAQWLLALLFVFAGAAKLVMPLQPIADQVGLPKGLLLFVGVMEVLGGLGLILPGLLHIRTGLIALAAFGLLIIMMGATMVTLQAGTIQMALFPFATGLVTAFVAYGRWRLVPLKHEFLVAKRA